MATPPPVHTSSVVIGPDTDLPVLPWYQFYERRVVGRALGAGLIGTSVATFLATIRPWTWFVSIGDSRARSTTKAALAWLGVGVSIATLVVGIRLRVRKYFKDPEAVREYIHLLHNSSFAVAFYELDSWDGILRIATPTMLSAKIERELRGFVPGVQIERFTFDYAWQLYNEVSRHPKLLDQMIHRQVVDISKLRELALRDLEDSLRTHDTVTPSGPPMEGSSDALQADLVFKRWPGLPPQSEARHLIYRMRTYGTFLEAFLGIPRTTLQQALRNDTFVASMAFDQLIQAQVRDLLSGPSPLFSAENVRHRAVEYIHTRAPKFGTFIRDFGRWLIDDRVLLPEDLSEMFRRDCIDSLDAVSLLDQWYPWPIKDHGLALGLSSAGLQLLISLNKQLEVARETFNKSERHIMTHHSTELNKLETRKSNALAKIPSSSPNQPSQSSTDKSASKSKQVPIVHVKKDGATHVTGQAEESDNSPTLTAERIAAEFDLEEMRLQDELDLASIKNKKSLQEVVDGINEAWRNFLHPELAKPSSDSNSSNVQINLNFAASVKV